MFNNTSNNRINSDLRRDAAQSGYADRYERESHTNSHINILTPI